MKSFIEYLSGYAAYHRDRRNIATHFIGIPMIVAAVVILLSRPEFVYADGVAITPALFAIALTALFYLKLDIRFGIEMTLFLLFCLWLGQWFIVLCAANHCPSHRQNSRNKVIAMPKRMSSFR